MVTNERVSEGDVIRMAISADSTVSFFLNDAALGEAFTDSEILTIGNVHPFVELKGEGCKVRVLAGSFC